MKRKAHARMFAIGTVAWMAFWLIGLPSYYQQYSNTVMVVFDVILLFVLACMFPKFLGKTPPERRMGISLWMAFYFTVPLAFYDWLYCGVYLGHGASFLWLYWYLSVYYLIPWLLLPGTAQMLGKMKAFG